MKQPNLQTERLILRPFEVTDAPDVQRLAGAREVAATTALIPHPYPDGAAEEWIGGHAAAFEQSKSVTFAIVEKESKALCGAIGLELALSHHRAEIGYWIAPERWGRGYCTEAARAVLQYGFETLVLHRINSCHFGSNPASGRVMQKIGMNHEGVQREHILKWDRYEDAVLYGLTVEDWRALKER
jgi:ribosomal-protein-alanine N-acetyltransferase